MYYSLFMYESFLREVVRISLTALKGFLASKDIYLSICLSIYLSIYLSICLSLSLYLYIIEAI